MKTISLIILIFCLSSTLWASNLAKMSVGAFSPYGVLGASYEKQIEFDENYMYAPWVGVGVGLLGNMTSVGMRGYKKLETDTSKWYGKCLFVFENCKEFVAVSMNLHYVNSSSVEVTKSDNSKLEFDVSSGWITSISISLPNIVNDKWFYELEISQRIGFSDIGIEQTSGIQDSSQRETFEDSRMATGLAFSLGYLW